MPTTITPTSTPGPIPTNGPVNSVPLATNAITAAAVAPAPHLEVFTVANGQKCFRVIRPLHQNTRMHDVIRVHLKSTTITPPKSFIFAIDGVDDSFIKRYVIQNKGIHSSEYVLDCIKNMGVIDDVYKLSYTQRNSSGVLVVASLPQSYSITV